MTYNKWNQYLGWFTFLLATIVYFITIEDTVSLWDCGEYITAAYKLEVGHPPGAPLFMVLGRLFSFFAEPEMVAVWINRLSALCSSLSILFMFWSITMLGKKMVLKRKDALSTGDMIAIFGSAFVGGMAYTFSESFWFSAVEGEVYAMASLFTAAIFWAILKWDEEMGLKQSGQLAEHIIPDRWLLLIMFLLGLAIGVHLLGILVVPAIGYLIYFRYSKEITYKNFILVGLLSVVVLGFIQEGVIPGSIALASAFEVTFVNSFGLPFFAGTIFFFGLIVAGAIYLIKRARKSGNHVLYNVVFGLVLLLIGYGSFAVIVIRSNANPPLDENDPENLVTLHAYLKREQYGSAPIAVGPYWNSQENPREEWKDRSAFYLRRFVVVKGDKDIKAFKEEADANAYLKKAGAGAEVVEKYFESNSADRKKVVPTYAQTTLFPRMYNSTDARKIGGYKRWSGYDASEDVGTELGKDKQRLPTMSENMTYFFNYQVNWMYWRYFLWNFAGRQNDIQGHGDQMRGNWMSGVSFIDDLRLGDQDNAPYYSTENPSHNKFFFLPIILGLIGLFFHYYRAPKDAFVLTLVFLFTGLAIVIYLNQKPFEPRERDYAYAGSFYFFAMWIGLSVLALFETFRSFGKEDLKKVAIAAGLGLVFFFALDLGKLHYVNTLSWIFISVIGLGLFGLMFALRKVIKKEAPAAGLALALGLIVPVVMGVQGWDDHDRSEKTSAHNLALNYLNSCSKNSILFTNGDNDTFPLWYMQEVEGKRTDVRVANLSLMQTDWYTNQMKMKAYDSDPLPIKFREEQILMSSGNTDQVLFIDFLDLFYMNADKNTLRKMIDMRLKVKSAEAERAAIAFNNKMAALLPNFTAGNGNSAPRLELLKRSLAGMPNSTLGDNLYGKFISGLEVLTSLRTGAVKVTSQEIAQQFQNALVELEKPWNYADLSDAMEFVRNDDNMISSDGRLFRIFPSKGFIYDVNAENAVKSGVITSAEVPQCMKNIEFNFSERGLTREQVMMLDVIANNEWKRGIFFASPAGSDVAMALYRARLLKQNGLAYELSPLTDKGSPINTDKMYKHLMETYNYGLMNKPGVLTDYYTRRHTRQYRTHFEVLAESYLRLGEEAEQVKSRGTSFIDMIRMQGQEALANRTLNIYNNADSLMQTSNKKAIEVIERSLAVMPIDLVFDHGEPNTGNDVYNYNGIQVRSMTDGSLHNYVNILFRAGAKKRANEVGMELAGQLESIIYYFLKNDAAIVAHPENTGDLFAAMDSYFKISSDALDAGYGDANGALAKHTVKVLEDIYKNEYPQLLEDLKQLAMENGESVRSASSRGQYMSWYSKIENQMEAMAVHYNFKNEAKPVDLNGLN